ncbi:UvrD-helicase domain-containing protein [Pseudomonas citronellolis]|uniref:UvrD-helicase domain-containing protein n=1 Tax=Pseudomonas citronellolis TaxID=53408 RepID=UPI002D782468|nr:UvrD-helicase domain-containing protein [Pseudomonas citronellolis]WRT85569.1 UvrD-helicase domain-containing protein [Pseudomonas citronellolis]
MNRFIAIEKDTAKEIVNIRQLQSTEYEEGKNLASLIKLGEINQNLMIQAHQTASGIILTQKSQSDEYLVFDLELFGGFKNSNNDESLIIFQKTLRTAIKFWDNIPFSSSEKNNQESGFLIMFPHSFAYGGYARVVIDKKPDSKRQEKRNGKHLLAFAYTKTEVNNAPPYTNFRKFLEEVKGIRPQIQQIENSQTTPLLIAELTDGFSPVDARIGFDTWKNLLTESQKNFVLSPHLGAARIEGPAGTGKTLSLILKCIQTALNPNSLGKKIIFITHSSATKENVSEIIEANTTIEQKKLIDSSCPVSIYTLQDWCLEKIGNQIQESELLDKDAESSKVYQQILIEEAFIEFLDEDFPTFGKLISKDLSEALATDGRSSIIATLMHEISEVIKGRASQRLEAYKKIDKNMHALPIQTEQDAECIFSIYTKYQKKLESVGNFDSDDIVISALNQLDSPIWRRRKNKEGFDYAFLDETHLFNLNELSAIHHLLKDDSATNITYSIDRSQSIANSSLTNEQLDEIFRSDNNQELNTVFRSSPEIIRLAFTILSAGSTLFTNLENPLDKTESSFTQADENRSKPPILRMYPSDDAVLQSVFDEVDSLAEQIHSTKSKICIIPCNEIIFSEIRRMVAAGNKSCEIILKRGDSASQKKAERGGKYIVAGIDYIGGLEFDGVVIVGCDKGNFPASSDAQVANARHFIRHASYNRLYVAITRAKYGITIISSSARGVSEILEPALQNGALQLI